MLAVQGPEARAIVAGARRRRAAAAHAARRRPQRSRAPRLVCGTGYTGEDGVEMFSPPSAARRSGTRCSRPAPTPAGLGGARHPAPRGLLPPLRQRPPTERNPIEAGLGWCCKEETGFIGSEAVAAARARRAPAEKLAPFAVDRAADPAPGKPDPRRRRRGRRGDQRHVLTLARVGIGMALRARRPGRAGDRDRDRRARQRRAARIESKPLYTKDDPRPKGAMAWPTRPIPRISSTTPSTTGPGSTATRPPSGSPGTRRTRSARSSSTSRPRSARRSARTPPTPRSSR